MISNHRSSTKENFDRLFCLETNGVGYNSGLQSSILLLLLLLVAGPVSILDPALGLQAGSSWSPAGSGPGRGLNRAHSSDAFIIGTWKLLLMMSFLRLVPCLTH